MSIALMGLLVFANTVCACSGGTDRVSDDANPHAQHQMQHQMQDELADGLSTVCPHQECDDCESNAMGAMPDRDGPLARVAKVEFFDDDVVWIEGEEIDIHTAPPLLARASPPLRRSLRFAESPVHRADVLLE